MNPWNHPSAGMSRHREVEAQFGVNKPVPYNVTRRLPSGIWQPLAGALTALRALL